MNYENYNVIPSYIAVDHGVWVEGVLSFLLLDYTNEEKFNFCPWRRTVISCGDRWEQDLWLL